MTLPLEHPGATVFYDGAFYEIAPPHTWIDAAEAALDANRLTEFVRIVLGAEQHAAFKATRPTLPAVLGLIGAIREAFGIDA